MLKSLAGSLIVCEKITTTDAKAKEIRGLVDKIINKAKLTKNETKKTAVLRDLRNYISNPAIKKITGSFLDNFSKRNSGYTRVIKLARRKSDNARMAIIEFV